MLSIQVFDVRLNGHMVVKDLDIFERVGHSTAHDEIVSFSIRRGKLSVQGEVSTFNGKLTVEFVKVPPPPSPSPCPLPPTPSRAKKKRLSGTRSADGAAC